MSDVCSERLVMSSTAGGGLVGEALGWGERRQSRWSRHRACPVAVAGRKVCSPAPLAAVGSCFLSKGHSSSGDCLVSNLC